MPTKASRRQGRKNDAFTKPDLGISRPRDFKHVTHVTVDKDSELGFKGLPEGWLAALKGPPPRAARPAPNLWHAADTRVGYDCYTRAPRHDRPAPGQAPDYRAAAARGQARRRPRTTRAARLLRPRRPPRRATAPPVGGRAARPRRAATSSAGCATRPCGTHAATPPGARHASRSRRAPLGLPMRSRGRRAATFAGCCGWGRVPVARSMSGAMSARADRNRAPCPAAPRRCRSPRVCSRLRDAAAMFVLTFDELTLRVTGCREAVRSRRRRRGARGPRQRGAREGRGVSD